MTPHALPSFLLLIGAARAAPPTPDHVVIVIEENHSFAQVIGSPDAPYLNSLAAEGANFTNFFAITHPSQPNYLQFYSGSNQGVTNNSYPSGIPFSSPNLGAAILAAGRTFATYCEDLPEVGSDVATFLAYARKHNPCPNWQNATPGPNQVPPSVNRPFFLPGSPPVPFFGDAAWPSDFSALPTVCIVVPNLDNDMHDGTIAQADGWLQQNIGPYATWAISHNSLLIITFDEDDSSAGAQNRIPTVFYGPMVTPGVYSATWTLHNLLRSIEDMYGAAHSGAAAQLRPILGPFTTDPQIATARFQQGSGHNGCVDTYIESAAPAASHNSSTLLVCDGSPLSQVLIRFDSIFGHAPGLIPPGAAIASAKLMLCTGAGSTDVSDATMSIHRLLTPWTGSSTWSSLGSGISTNGIEAAAAADFAVIANVNFAWAIFDVSDTVQAWTIAGAAATNHGWVVVPAGTDGWRFLSAESADPALRPVLEVTWIAGSVCAVDWNGDHAILPADVAAFVNDWSTSLATGSLEADFDRNGAVQPVDVATFVSEWIAALSAGC